MAQHRSTTNTVGPVSQSCRGRVTNIGCDSPLSEYYLLLDSCWSITHFLYSLPLQRPPHHHHHPCGPVMELMLITVPGSLCSVYSCTGAERHAGKAADAERRVLMVTDGCALPVCIYAFKLPSAVHIPNDKRRNKRELEHFHLRGPLPQPSAAA